MNDMKITLSMLLGNSTKKTFDTLKKGFLDLSKQFANASAQFAKMNQNDVSKTLSKIAKSSEVMGKSMSHNTEQIGTVTQKLFALEDRFKKLLGSQTKFGKEGRAVFDEYEEGSVTIGQVEQKLEKLNNEFKGFEKYGQSVKAVQKAWEHYSKSVENGRMSVNAAMLETEKFEKAVGALELDLKKANVYTADWAKNLSFAKVRQAEIAGQLKVTAGGFTKLTESGREALQMDKKQAQALKTLQGGLTAYQKQLTKAHDIKKKDIATGEAYEKVVKSIGQSVGYNAAKFDTYVKHIEGTHRAFMQLNTTLPTHEKELRSVINGVNKVSLAEESLKGNLKVVNNRFQVLNKDGLKPFGNITLQTAKNLGILDRSFDKITAKEKEYAQITGQSIQKTQKISEAMFRSGQSVDSMAGKFTRLINATKRTQKLNQDLKVLSLRYEDLMNSSTKYATRAEALFKEMRSQGTVTQELKTKLSQLDKEYKSAAASQKKQEDQMKRLKAEYSGLEETTTSYRQEYYKQILAFKNGEKEYEDVNRALKKLSTSYNQTRNAQRKAEEEAKVLQARYKRLLESTSKYGVEADQLIRKLKKQPSALRQIREELKRTEKDWNKNRNSLNRTTEEVGKFGNALGKLGKRLQIYSQYFFVSRVINGFTQSLRLAGRAIVEHNQGLHDLKAILNATTAEVAMMDETLVETSQRTKFSLGEAAEGMRILGQAGYDAIEVIEGFPAIADLATGTLSTMDTTVKLVTTALKDFQIEASETARVADIFGNAVNRSKLTLDGLNTSFNYIGPTAKAVGLDLEDTAASMMILANSGVRASTQGTGLRRVLGELISPSAKLKERIHEVGLTVDDVNPQIVGMEVTLKNLQKVVSDASFAFDLFGQRGANIMTAFMEHGEDFAQFKEDVQESGAVARMAEEQMKGLEVAIKNLKDRFGVMSSVLAEESGFISGLKMGLNLLRGFMGIVTEVAGTPIGSLITALTGLTIVLGSTTAAILVLKGTKLASFFMAPIHALTTLSAGLSTLGFKAIVLRSSLSALSPSLYTLVSAINPVTGAIAAAIATLGVLRVVQGKNAQAIRESINANAEYLKSLRDVRTSLNMTNKVLEEGNITQENLSKRYQEVSEKLAELSEGNDVFRKKSVELFGEIQAGAMSISKLTTHIEEMQEAMDKIEMLKLGEQARDAYDLAASYEAMSKAAKSMALAENASLVERSRVGYVALKEAVEKVGSEQEKQAFKTLEQVERIKAAKLAANVDIEKSNSETVDALLKKNGYAVDKNKVQYEMMKQFLTEYILAQKEAAEEAKKTDLSPSYDAIKTGYERALSYQGKFAQSRLDEIEKSKQKEVEVEEAYAVKIQEVNTELARLKVEAAKDASEKAQNSERVEKEKRIKLAEEVVEAQRELNEEENALREARIKAIEASYEKEIATLDAAEQEKLNELKKARLENYEDVVSYNKDINDLELRMSEDRFEKAKKYYDKIKNSENSTVQDVEDAHKELISAESEFIDTKLKMKENQYVSEEDMVENTYKRRINQIETNLALEIIAEEDARRQKMQAEVDYAQKIFNLRQNQFDSVKNEHSEDTKQYQDALNKKVEAYRIYMQKMAKLKGLDTQSTDENTDANNENSDATDENSKKKKKNSEENEENARTTRKVTTSLDELSMSYEKFQKYANTKKLEQFWYAMKGMSDGYKAIMYGIEDAYNAVGKAANSLGFNVDYSNKTLDEAKSMLESAAPVWQDFEEELASISEELKNTSSASSDFSASAGEAEISLQELRKEASEVSTKASELYNTSWVNADSMKTATQEVIDQYKKILEEGKEKIASLKEEWQSLADKIESVNDQILQIEADTQSKIRDLKRKTMTEEEVWLDKKAEYNEKIKQAEQAQSQGQYNQAVALFKEAQDVAKELSTEVKNDSDQVVKSLEETTQTSMGLIESAADKMKGALKNQKDTLVNQQQSVRGEIDQTSNSLSNLASQIKSINNFSFNTSIGEDYYKNFTTTNPYQDSMTNKFADGGLANGPSHSQGGIPIEVEGGEHIQPVSSVQHYGKKGLDFLEGFRHKVFPKNFFENLPKPRMSFSLGGAVPKVPAPKMSLPSYASGGSVKENVQTYQFKLDLNGSNYGPFRGQKDMVEGMLNELKKAQRLA